MPLNPLPTHLCDQVRSLSTQLEQLQSLLPVLPDQVDASTSEAANPSDIQQRIIRVQAQLQKIVATLAAVDIPPAVEQRLRSYQTEAHRRSRLLGIEAMRLKTAKQPNTIERVRSQIKAHLSQLQQFVQAIAGEVCP